MWIVYVLRCADGSLYTGRTTDLERRLKQHNDGKGGKYTRSHRPCVVVYSIPADNAGEAAREEARIKRLPRAQKLELLKG